MEQDQEVVTCKIAMLLKKYGIRTMTIDEISKKAYISKAKLHAFFGNKEQILQECLDYMNNDLQMKLITVMKSSDTVIKKLHDVYQITFDHLSEFHSMFYNDLRKHSTLRNKIQEYNKVYRAAIVYPLLEEAQKQKQLVSDTDINEASDFFMKFIFDFLMNSKKDNESANTYMTSFMDRYIERGQTDLSMN